MPENVDNVDNVDEEQPNRKSMSRSQFIKGVGAALVGAVAASVGGALIPKLAQTPPEPPKTDVTGTPTAGPFAGIATSTPNLRAAVPSATPSLQPTTDTAGLPMEASLINFKSDLQGATIRTVQQKLSEYVSAADFGAVPNGDAVQNYVALSKALDAVAGTKATLLLRAGVYPVSGELLLKSDVTVAGDGMRGSIIMGVSDAPSIFAVRNVQKVMIRDLGFIAKEAVTVAQAVNAIGATDLLVERCWFDKMFFWSVYIGARSLRCGVVNSISEGTAQGHCIEINGSSYCYVTNCHLKNSAMNGIEIYHNRDQECIGNRLISNHIADSRAGGIVSLGERYVAIIGNTVVASARQGIRIQRSEVDDRYIAVGGALVGNSVLNCGQSGAIGIDLANDTLAWSMSGNTSQGSGSAGIGVLGVAHTISGNICIENARDGMLIGQGSHVVSHNTCINNNAAGHSNSGVSGINILSDGSSYMGNICADTRAAKLQEYGINVQGSNNTFTGNVTTGNKLGGLNDQNPSRNNIKAGNI